MRVLTQSEPPVHRDSLGCPDGRTATRHRDGRFNETPGLEFRTGRTICDIGAMREFHASMWKGA
jgi:hypothetical protein